MTPETSPTFEGALVIEKKRADDRDARLRAEAWAAGAAAMRREAADYLACRGDCKHRAGDIRTLPIPEYRNG